MVRDFWLRLTHSVTSFIVRRVGFWESGLYGFDVTTNSVLLAKDCGISKRFLIVGREHYYEVVKDYPVGSLSDLRQILSNEAGLGPYSGTRFNEILRVSDQSHRVTSWIIKDSVLNSINPRPWLVFPESACIAAMDLVDPIVTTRLGRQLVTAKGSGGLVSFLSENSFAEEEHPNAFFGAALPNDPTHWNYLHDHESSMHLWAGFQHLLVSAPWVFFVPIDTRQFRRYPWSMAMSLVGIALAGYFMVTSLILLGESAWLDQRLDAVKIEADLVLDDRTGFDKRVSVIEELNKLNGVEKPVWSTWDIVLDLRLRDVLVTNVVGAGGVVTFYGFAPRASEVMEWLNGDQRVDSVEYASPMSVQNGKEKFTIEVTLSASSKQSEFDLEDGGLVEAGFIKGTLDE